MTWRPLSNRAGGGVTDVQFDANGDFVTRTLQRVDPILDVNHEQRGLDDRGWCMGGDMRRVASIPNVIVAEWLKEGIDIFSGECQDRLAAKLNDPEWAYLRTAPGHLGPVGDGTYR